MIDKLMVVIGDSPSDIASFNEGDDGDDDYDEETEQGQPSEDDEPSWVMGTITKMLQHRMESFWQKQMKLDELTQPGWEAAAEYFSERDKKYSTSEWRVPAVVQPRTDQDAAAPAPTTFTELMEYLDIVPGISRMPQGTSRPGSSRMKIGSGQLQSNIRIPCLAPASEPDSSLIQNAKPVELVSFDLGNIGSQGNHH
jgi:hypothetical protein